MFSRASTLAPLATACRRLLAISLMDWMAQASVTGLASTDT